jgi:lysophospholipase L1-like esterase
MLTNDLAKTIVCYGDSNTWGRVPEGERYPRSVRWVGALQNLLGDNYEVINEGLNGRTFVAEDPTALYKTGITHLRSMIKTSLPIDLMIVMLGTNDVKVQYNLTAEKIAKDLETTIKLIKEYEIKKILVLCPPAIVDRKDGIIDERYVNRKSVTEELAANYQRIAEKEGCSFLDAGKYITCSVVDGFHFEPEAHKKLAEVLSEEIKKTI